MKSRIRLRNSCSHIKPEFSDQIEIHLRVYRKLMASYTCTSVFPPNRHFQAVTGERDSDFNTSTCTRAFAKSRGIDS